jgi:cyclophilin family peptidyl-prolyl cis-trans isomerase
MEEKLLNRVSAFANPELIEKMNIEKEKLKKAQSQADKLRSQVIAHSKQDAVKKYGGGDIRIKMDLVFPTTTLEDGTVLEDTGPHSIVMEMAPLDLMPHSVYTFLEMISEGLLDGCSFIINAMHELKAAPLPYDGSPASIKAKQFSDSGLESVAFKEYSPEFPHEKYTIGFAADGSPSFYINSEDNSDIHVGDPCFAKIVSGYDTVQRLDELPTRNGIWFENRVGIKKVHIL